MSTEFADTKLEYRFIGAALALELGKNMATGGFWILETSSITGKVALMSTYPAMLAMIWISLAALVVPFILLQVFGIGFAYARAIKGTACRAMLLGGVIWCYLGYLSKNLDFAYVTEIFMLNGTTCVVMSAVIAFGLNNDLRRSMDTACPPCEHANKNNKQSPSPSPVTREQHHEP